MEDIKIKSTVVPNEQLTYNEWAKQFRVSILWNSNKLTDKANQMMSLWDDRTITNYIKKLKVG
jgi:hypothetical protein